MMGTQGESPLRPCTCLGVLAWVLGEILLISERLSQILSGEKKANLKTESTVNRGLIEFLLV